MGFTGFYRVLLGFTWVLLGFTGYFWVWFDFRLFVVMATTNVHRLEANQIYFFLKPTPRRNSTKAQVFTWKKSGFFLSSNYFFFSLTKKRRAVRPFLVFFFRFERHAQPPLMTSSRPPPIGCSRDTPLPSTGFFTEFFLLVFYSELYTGLTRTVLFGSVQT